MMKRILIKQDGKAIADYSDYGLTVEKVLEKLEVKDTKDLIIEEFDVYCMNGMILTPEEYAIKVQKKDNYNQAIQRLKNIDISKIDASDSVKSLLSDIMTTMYEIK